MILNYQIFENLQQAEKIMKSQTDSKTISFFEKLKNLLTETKKLNYIVSFLKYYLEMKDEKLILDYVKKFIDYHGKLDLTKLETFSEFQEEFDFLSMKTDVTKFIEEYVPGFLKSKMKEKANIIILGNIIPQIKNLTKLRGMVSLFRTGEEYLNYLKSLTIENPIEALTTSKDVKILSKTDKYIIYVPKTFEAMNIIIFNKWCTIDRVQWDKYIDLGYTNYVYYDIDNIVKSYMLMVNDGDFYVSDYDNKVVCTDENIDKKINRLPKSIFILIKEALKVDDDLHNLIDDELFDI